MDNRQLTKLASRLVTKRREKRAFIGGLIKLVKILSKTKAGLKLIPRATQMAKEAPKAFSKLTNKNIGKKLVGSGWYGGKAPPLPRRPPPVPRKLPSRLAPPPPLQTRLPNPNFKPNTGGGTWRSPNHLGPTSPLSRQLPPPGALPPSIAGPGTYPVPPGMRPPPPGATALNTYGQSVPASGSRYAPGNFQYQNPFQS